MSTALESGDINKTNKQEDGWDDDEDNWEDWGDAEDNFSQDGNQSQKIPMTTETKKKDDKNISENLPADKVSRNNADAEESYKQKQQLNQEQLGSNTFGSVWKPFGVLSSVLTEGIGNITSTVSHGLNHVIGVPEPEELARINATENNKEQTKKFTETENKSEEISENKSTAQSANTTPVFGLSLVSGVTNLGSKVLNTGLDTLEGIGKKTMTILQENDPLLMNKRKLLGFETNKPNLSEILKEAKEESDQLENTLKELKIERSKQMLRFEVMFENNCGLVHYEALGILSKGSELKLQTLLESVTGKALTELQDTINEVKELIEMEEFELECDGDYQIEELKQNFMNAMEDVDLSMNFDDIIGNWSENLNWITNSAEQASEDELFAKGLTCLAETCSLELSKLHKIAELILVKEHHSTASEVDCIVSLCKHFHTHLIGLSNRFARILSTKDTELAKNYITQLFAEMQLATKYIEQSFQLFLPIIQIGAV